MESDKEKKTDRKGPTESVEIKPDSLLENVIMKSANNNKKQGLK